MKLLLLCVILAAVGKSHPLDEHLSESQSVEWENFKTVYSRNYQTVEEEDKRKHIFMKNLKFINKHNERFKKGKSKYYLSVNQFADLTREEISSRMSGVKAPARLETTPRKIFQKSELPADIPDSYDWSTEGAVTRVKNQMNCSNGGWAFSATGALEGQLFIKEGSLKSLSEQNLIDCSSAEGNQGCEGGSAEGAFAYVQKKKGIDAELDYIFEDGTGSSCKFKKNFRVKMNVKGYVQVTSTNEIALQAAVYNIGPISAAINAQETDFIFYKGGVYDSDWCFSTAEYLNHYVLVVGWDYSYDYGDYWILKNSWGDSWGLSGYMYLSRFNFNLCGIATNATYPVLS